MKWKPREHEHKRSDLQVTSSRLRRHVLAIVRRSGERLGHTMVTHKSLSTSYTSMASTWERVNGHVGTSIFTLHMNLREL